MSLKNLKTNPYQTKRGDTIIEVMFAIAVFCLVAVISISMMNTGVAQAEGSLEVVTARNELNAQAEALRFVHSSYISERTLPECSTALLNSGEKCQQYTNLWTAITNNAIEPSAMTKGNEDLTNLGEVITQGCTRLYDNSTGSNILVKNHAFIMNTRDLQTIDSSTQQVSVERSFIPTNRTVYTFGREVSGQPGRFVEAPLNARIIFNDGTGSSLNSTTQITDQTVYNRVLQAEGIWIVAVKGKTNALSTGTEYYDFYIQSCWYGPNTKVPQSIDTIIRLYNPEGL